MAKLTRKPFQGITNIIRFNWHFYVLAVAFVLLAFALLNHLPQYQLLLNIAILLVFWSVGVSIAVSWFIYDYSRIYTFNWLAQQDVQPGKCIVNVNAGFDEVSHLLNQKYQPSQLTIFDFYDPKKHTEVSIARARKAYPPYQGTINISTSAIPAITELADYIFVVFSAHEIRETNERIEFLKQLNHKLTPEGKIIILEHLRDVRNFAAYNIGFLHFYPRSEWLNNFESAVLTLKTEVKVTPFLSAFILQKNGVTS